MISVHWKPTLALLAALVFLSACGKKSAEDLLKEGSEALAAEKYERARSRLEAALHNFPGGNDAAHIHNMLGIAKWRLGNKEEAEEHFRKAQKEAPRSPTAYYNLGVVLDAGNSLAGATEMLQRASQIDENDTRALEYLAQAFIRKTMWTEAQNILLRASQRDPASPRIHNALGVAGLQTEGSKYAIQQFKKCLDLQPGYPAALFNLGIVFGDREQDREGALIYLRRYLSLNVENAPSRRKIAENLVAKYEKQIADSMDPSRPQAPTVPIPEEGRSNPLVPRVPVPPGPEPVASNEVDEMLNKAKAAQQNGEEGDALNLCLQAAAIASRDNDAALEEKAYRMAVALCPDQPRAHYALGRFFTEEGNHREAMKAFRQAAIQEPNWSRALRAAAAAAIECNELTVALEMLRQAVQVDPDNPETRWALALFYETQLKLGERARGEYEKFLNRFPDDERAPEARRRLQELGGPSNSSAPTLIQPTPAGLSETAPGASTARSEVTRIQPVNVTPATMGTVMTPRRTPDIAPVVPVVSTTDMRSASPRPAADSPARAEMREQIQRLINKGAYHQGRDELDQALGYFQEAIRLQADSAVVFFNTGLIYHKKKQYDAAKTAYLRAIEIDPGFMSSRFNLGVLYYENNQYDDALRELTKVIQSVPTHARAHLVLGRVYEQAGARADLAKYHFSRFVELEPNATEAAKVRRWLLQN